MKTKPLYWQLNNESLYATGVNCEYSIHVEHGGVRLFITEHNKRPLLTDFKTFKEAMSHAQADNTKRVKRWIVKPVINTDEIKRLEQNNGKLSD